jgi:DNA-binding protein H-NS
MAESASERITEWLEIKLDTLTSEERIRLVEEIFDTLAPQELRILRDSAEARQLEKLEHEKNQVLTEVRSKLNELGLTFNDVFPQTKRKRRVAGSALRIKYRSPDGETWTGRGRAPKWIQQLELAGHRREEFLVKDESV